MPCPDGSRSSARRRPSRWPSTCWRVPEPAPPGASLAPQVAGALASVIDRCLRKGPDARFADGGAIADALAHDTAVDRPVPVALRVFIKRLRALIQSTFATSMLVSLFAVPQLMSENGALGLVLVLTAGLALVGGGHLGSLAYEARKVLKAGHTLADPRLALQLDVTRWNAEHRL